MKLVILAAGLGSRFGGVKQLASIGSAGETLLEYNVFNAAEAGFDSVVFLIRKDIEEDFRTRVLSRLPRTLPVELAFQAPDSAIPEKFSAEPSLRGRTKPWGTGHALLCARLLLEDGPFAVINADDFYGKSGFAAVHGFLAENSVTPVAAARARLQAKAPARVAARAAQAPADAATRFCLAGYRLGNVVSASGSVSRAVCSLDAEGWLKKIVEHTRVEIRSGNIYSVRADGSAEALSPELPISMNLWGLTPAVFPFAERLFSEFLSDPAHWGRSEFYLPTVIGGMMDEGAAKVMALPVTEEYFGLTNPDDILDARKAIAERAGRGEYPEPLWNEYGQEGRNPR
ncbi:MAG TPA: NTP transferase domain-containing protein [Rectinemataceae bacterium]|nr:NTP transferase domain-containing protein [Rectinemataceae bacterium]